MKNGLVVADSGPIFSLALVDKLYLLDALFDKVIIAQAVWDEITMDSSKPFHYRIATYFQDKKIKIQGFNDLTFVMDYGESESLILFKEQKANFLLIDDKKARTIAENFNVNCIGTIGLLSIAKDKGLITALRPIFIAFTANNRYYSINLLNAILIQNEEVEISL